MTALQVLNVITNHLEGKLLAFWSGGLLNSDGGSKKISREFRSFGRNENRNLNFSDIYLELKLKSMTQPRGKRGGTTKERSRAVVCARGRASSREVKLVTRSTMPKNIIRRLMDVSARRLVASS